MRVAMGRTLGSEGRGGRRRGRDLITEKGTSEGEQNTADDRGPTDPERKHQKSPDPTVKAGLKSCLCLGHISAFLWTQCLHL